MLQSSITFQNQTMFDSSKSIQYPSITIKTDRSGNAMLMLVSGSYAQTRLSLVKYYPQVGRDIANHKIDAAMIITGPIADNTITSQPN
jgi:hypothetical protein